MFASDLLLSVITASAPNIEASVFKPPVASSFLEGLGVTGIAAFLSQAEKLNVSIRLQTRKTITNEATVDRRGGDGQKPD